GPPNFPEVIGKSFSRKLAPPKKLPATRVACARGAPLCANNTRERHPPRLYSSKYGLGFQQRLSSYRAAAASAIAAQREKCHERTCTSTASPQCPHPVGSCAISKTDERQYRP